MDDAERFWTWTLAFYAGPGISPAFLHLQDGHGADVNILLYLLWQASEGNAAVTEAECAALDAAISDWRRDVIAPLRGLRRMLKGQGEDEVRSPIAAAELAAERSAQRRLVAALPGRAAVAGSVGITAGESIAAYAAFMGAPFHEASVAALLDALSR